jgi:hypothetical protein
MTDEREEYLLKRLADHTRIQWMADAEARSAWVRGTAARGVHTAEKERLLEKTERILDELERITSDGQ